MAPLLRMVGELTHRGEELAQILTLKDKEIQDYKEQGARVSRSMFIQSLMVPIPRVYLLAYTCTVHVQNYTVRRF